MPSNLVSDVIMGGRQTPGFTSHPTDDMREGVMSVLRSHFRPEFLNRIDEIIIFHGLDQEQIKSIVNLQLERVRKTAQGQDVDLVFDDSILEHLAERGYQPEYGARELRRQIRQLIETKLAKEMLKGAIKEGNRVLCSYDEAARDVIFTVTQDVKALQKTPAKTASKKAAKKTAKKAAKKPAKGKAHGAKKKHIDELLEETFPASDGHP
ncbi:hypothetical protein AB4072_00985 [Microvirga sp. 2MCAF38]|uniref:hypothetical protein n=1 Tax=Microvirga sp. 2MCAF38 TaxID=3232989 RepID=UPI003F991687